MNIHTIKFSIDFDMINLNEDKYAEIMDIIETQMKEKHPDGILFEELKQIIPLDKLKFHPVSIQYPDLSRDDYQDVSFKETKIEIKA